jgi:hypothetical protein
MDWAAESVVTETEYVPGSALADEPALTAVRSVEAAVVALKVSALKSGPAASRNADTADWSWPKTESWVCSAFEADCSFLKGACSTAINFVTMLLTSRPLPIPAEEIVGRVLLIMGVLVEDEGPPPVQG